ncbi:MAG: GNAT family N-acetyltransferase [Kangiellaceae bacterium]|nr:GNAT family N-acetyltransferase [Kangiellaceae bacterium]
MNIKLLEINEIEEFVPHFDSYRQRYKQDSEVERISEFLRHLLEKQAAKIFVSYESSEDQQHMTGFVILYPSYSSIGLAPIWILNDFYVFAGEKKRETARALLDQAAKLCKLTDAIRIEVTTRKENYRLHKLYKEYGFEKDYKYDYYFLRIDRQESASKMLK